MTGNLYMLNMMMNLNNEKATKDANVQAAEDVGKKAELGWFDVEFTMYGCAYLDRAKDKMFYKVSTKAEDIYDFIEESARKEIYPGKVKTLTLKCPVPVGMRELISQDVKRELAKVLKDTYRKAFFEELHQIADENVTNTAAKILWEEAEEIEGKFEEEGLRRFEELVHYSYSCKKLNREEYHKLLSWIEEERKNMDEDFVSKDIFEKTMYGIAYEEDGAIRYLTNAQRDYVYEKAHKMEQRGIFVTPVYSRTYWYNYIYRLPDVINDFKKELKKECNQEYIEKIKKIRKGTEDKKEDFEKKIEEIKEKYGESSTETMMRYGHRWNVS